MSFTPARAASRVAFFALLCVPVLLPFGRSSELGCLLAIIACAMQGWADPKGSVAHWKQSLGAHAFMLMFAAALISVIDAQAFKTSLTGTLALLRFLPLILAASLLDPQHIDWLKKCVAICLLVWLADAMVQASTGVGLRGSSIYDRISGIFGDDNIKLGLALVAWAPMLMLESETRARLLRNRVILIGVAWLVIACVLLLAGQRAAWVSFAMLSVLWALRLLAKALPQWSSVRRVSVASVAACTLIAVLGGALYQLDTKFKGRVDRTLALAQDSRAQQDFALAGRLPIWQTAVDMSLAHPVNGVGLRGFRVAYPEFAQPGDPWLALDEAGVRVGANHPHQLLLELSCETGLLGVLLVSLAAWLLIQAYWRACAATQESARAFAWCLIAMLFPLNTHSAYFSSFWALVLWWTVAMLSASLHANKRHA